ncbi:MAG: hypothetical protein HQM08_17320 [Candidatus Riflebacteria bacterium]|nr:hypothetical protein [Candidatus Riflebacteria bacterium]
MKQEARDDIERTLSALRGVADLAVPDGQMNALSRDRVAHLLKSWLNE